MSGKQLYSKTNSNYEEITPLTYIQNVIDENSKNSLDQILKIYNHIYIEFENNNTTTRNKVPKELRHSGLTITYYDNINNKLITERFNRDDNVANSNTAWLLNKHWDKLLYDSDIFEKGIKVHIPDSSITINMLSDSLKQLFENKKGVIINYPDEEDLTIQNPLLIIILLYYNLKIEMLILLILLVKELKLYVVDFPRKGKHSGS